MLTLQLTLDNKQTSVHVDGQESHTFSLLDLGQTDKEWKDFFKDPRPYGRKLFQALFKDASEARNAFDELSKQVERTIVLVLELSELDSIAWEYAYHDNAYIVEEFAFMRALPEKERSHSNGRLNKSVERAPLLFIPANPLVNLSGEPMRELDTESEWREITQHIVKSNAPFDLIELRPATPAALQSVMARFQNGMIAHFSGHGAATKDGAFLLFENENGSSNPLEAREFVREVKDQAWIGFLSACQSAVAERTEYSNLARELVKAGVPFALGMQFNFPDPFAPNISGQFYNYLSQGHAVPEAARQARRAVKRENEFYVGMIALYAAHPDETEKMGWTGSDARTLPTFAAADVSDLPTPSGFIGRQRELMNIGTNLLGKKKPNTVTLHGAGGIGKTALMRHALLRFAPSFEAALAIALDPLPSLESVLGRIERFLNLPSPCSNETKEREQIVRGKLTGRVTLLGLDNFETLIHARDNGSDEEKKTAKSLYALFKSLAAEGVTLCVTSRENTSLPGETIQEIYGLEDEVGGRLFQNTVSTRRDALDEIGLEKISAAVGGHPLALRLLAPIFEEQAGLTLDDFVQKLETFLPKARDEWTEQERHVSLDACFAFSMDNLPKNGEGKKLKLALAKLSVFMAGFIDFTAAPILVNHLPDNYEQFEKMRPDVNKILNDLWEHGLLERLVLPLENENYYLFRFHPAVNQFAATYLSLEDTLVAKEMHYQVMCQLARLSFPASEGNGIYGSSFLSAIARYAMPDMLKAANFKQNKETSVLVFHLAFLHRHFGDIDEAMRLYRQSLQISEELGDLQGKFATLHEIAYIRRMRSDLDGAMKLYQQCLEINEGLDDLKGKSYSLHNMAQIYVMRGDIEKAMELYQRSLEIKNELGDLKEISDTLHAIAGIHIIKRDLDKAMILYHDALKIYQSLNYLKGESATLHQLAGIYANRGSTDQAINLYTQSLKLFDELGDLEGRSATLHQLAGIFSLNGNLEEAKSLYQESLKIHEKLGNVRGKFTTLAMIGQLFVETEDYEKALSILIESAEKLSEIGANNDLEKTIGIIKDVRIKIGFEKFDGIWKNITTEPIPSWLEIPVWSLEQPVRKPDIPKEGVVLVVDDNVSNFVLVARMLGYLGIHCEWKTSGYEVIEYSNELPRLDLILMDINTPFKDNYGELKKIRDSEKFSAVPVIAVATEASPQKMKKAKASGFDGFLSKPFDPDHFPDQIRRILNGEAVWEVENRSVNTGETSYSSLTLSSLSKSAQHAATEVRNIDIPALKGKLLKAVKKVLGK